MAGGVRLGAFPDRDATTFGVFATTASEVAVRVEGSTHALAARGDGFFEARVQGIGHGALYSIVLDGRALPDPYARALPDGVHGPAMVIEPRHVWRDDGWSPRPLRELSIYELHVGTFTPGGTFRSARERLPWLADLGVGAVELMPISAFAGRRGWGYDGVAHFAPHAAYGTPDELRAFVDEAHRLGLSVLLDVVYNHFGPAGSYLAAYSPLYFTDRIENAWGDAPDFTHPVMRRYVLDNARQWLDDFHFDGLRLDAIHALSDPSDRHVLRELAADVRRLHPAKVLIAEDERNDRGTIRDLGMDAVWADDFHHQLRVTLTGERDGYYGSFEPRVERIADVLQRGWLRGAPAGDLPAEAFVYCIQNHDQIGNRALGDRLSDAIPLDLYRAVSMLLLFLPMTPLLFMGQEWAASSPFLYFTDHEEELGKQVSAGRRAEFAAFDAFTDPGKRELIPDPQAVQTFLRSRLDWDERSRAGHAGVVALYRAMLGLRRTDPVLRVTDRTLAAVASGDLLCVERQAGGQRRLLALNLGATAVALRGLPFDAGSLRPMLVSDGSSDLVLGALAPRTGVILA